MDGIICFSVRFYDNSLVKMRFQVFYFATKKVQGFSSDRKIMSLLSVLFHQQNCVSVFEILIFSKDIWGNVHCVPGINLISQGTLIKVFLSHEQNKLSEI